MKILFILVLLFSFPAFSQVVNIESDRGSEKQGIHGNSEVGLSLIKGNVQILQTQTALRLDYIKNHHHTMFIGSLSYAEEDEKTFQNESYVHLRWTSMWWRNRTIGTELFSQLQKDEFKLLRVRKLLGGGLRFTFFKDILALGVGGMSDYEEIEGNKGGNLDPRANSYLRLGKEWKTVKGQIIAYYQPLFNNTSDYRILTTGSLEFKLDKVFSLVNELNYAYDTKPPEDVIKDDLMLRFKFKIKW